MIKNLFFDFDGTIFDSYDHTTTAFIKTIKDSRNITLDYKEVYDALKESFGVCFDKYNVTKEERAMFDINHKNIKAKPLVVPYKETKKVLKKLYKSGCNLFIYTNRDTQTIYYLKKYHMYKYFKDFLLAGMFGYKPDPEGLEYMIKKYNLKKEETVVVGDRILDIQGGKNASIDGVLINSNKKDDIVKYYINSLYELLVLINE